MSALDPRVYFHLDQLSLAEGLSIQIRIHHIYMHDDLHEILDKIESAQEFADNNPEACGSQMVDRTAQELFDALDFVIRKREVCHLN